MSERTREKEREKNMGYRTLGDTLRDKVKIWCEKEIAREKERKRKREGQRKRKRER